MQECLRDPMIVYLDVEEEELYYDLDIAETDEDLHYDLDVEETIVVDSSDHDYYTGDYVVTPKAHASTVLETNDKIMRDDVTVLEIPYYETSNLGGGYTVFIAGEVQING